MGVSVFAALQQSAELIGSITVTDEGQAKSNIIVSYFVGPTDASEYNALTTEPSFVQLLSKSKNEDTKSSNTNLDVDFSYFNNFRYYIYKVQIENLSSVEVTYTTTFWNTIDETISYHFDSQTEVLYAINTNNGGFELTAGNNGSGQIAVNGSLTYYVVVQVKNGVTLWNIINSAESPYKMRISVVS